MGKLNRLIDWLIPDHLKATLYIYRKAKVLTSIHLFVLALAVILWVTTQVLTPENDLPLIPGILLLLFFIYAFKKWGNLGLSGNLLALAWALTLIQSVFETGSLYSDNLLWLIVTPLLAFLFASRLSGVLWSGGLLGLLCYCYVLEINKVVSEQMHTLMFDSTYYFISYFFLFVAILAIILIFKKGKEDIISMLQEQSRKLSEQKKEITFQANELKKVGEALKSTNHELEHFAYAASHDLKEPLRMINSYTTLIQKSISSHLDKETKEYMGFVTNGVGRMEKLLDDLLEYSRLGQKGQKKKITDLNDILMIVVNNLMVPMNQNRAAVCTKPLPSIYSSSTEMMQLFQNIISNAIKFKKVDTDPLVTISAEEYGDQFYHFSIEDNGIGIPEKDQDRVFAIFERLHNKSEFEGTGIGLATCKKIINNMGGKIWLSSVYGEGTTFHFTLPRSLDGDEYLN